MGLKTGYKLPEQLKKDGMTNPTDEQLNMAMKVATQEYYAILFLYKANCHKYREVIEEMEIVVLSKQDPFPKSVTDAWQLLT